MKLSDKQIAQARTQRKTSVTATMIAEAAVDEHAKDELLLYIENTAELYPMKEQIIRNMSKKIDKGTYDLEMAVKGWMHWVDEGAKLYKKEIGSQPGNEPVAFPRDLRLAVARQVAEQEEEKIKAGEYAKTPPVGDPKDPGEVLPDLPKAPAGSA
jgi:hypothetical protein